MLREEEDPAVRVVLGHFILVYIHPYIDGNGRIGHCLMSLPGLPGRSSGSGWRVRCIGRTLSSTDVVGIHSSSCDADAAHLRTRPLEVSWSALQECAVWAGKNKSLPYVEVMVAVALTVAVAAGPVVGVVVGVSERRG